MGIGAIYAGLFFAQKSLRGRYSLPAWPRASHHSDTRSAKLAACVCQSPIAGTRSAMLFSTDLCASPNGYLPAHQLFAMWHASVQHLRGLFAISHLPLSITSCRLLIMLFREAIRGWRLRAQSMRNYILPNNLCEAALHLRRGPAPPHQSPCLHVFMPPCLHVFIPPCLHVSMPSYLHACTSESLPNPHASMSPYAHGHW